jgi:hypothetical protein
MGSMKPERLIASCLNANKSNQYAIVYYFYSPSSDVRLSDEDFREIFFHLTDAHADEVDDDPDPIHLLSQLSEAESTTMNAGRAISILKTVLTSDDNELRAEYMRPLFQRIDARDLHSLIMRMSVRTGVARRRHIIAALAWVNGELYYQIKRASYLVGMERTCFVLSQGDDLYPLIQPKTGIGIIIPSPTYVGSPDEVKFTGCYMEHPEGEWMTLHVMEDSIKLFDSSGSEVDMEGGYEIYLTFPEGIYLVEYASHRGRQLLVCDILNDKNLTYANRRKALEERLPKWALKKVKKLSDPTDASKHITKDKAVILWNADGVNTYENTHYEMVVMSAKVKKKPMFRIISGKWVESIHGSHAPLVGKWRVAARDGNSYYPVGLIEAEPDVAKKLKQMNPSSTKLLNDEFTLTTPVFVEAEVNAAGWGDYGPYIHGRIISIVHFAGKKDCVGIEEIEMLCGMDEDGTDGQQIE